MVWLVTQSFFSLFYYLTVLDYGSCGEANNFTLPSSLDEHVLHVRIL